MKIKILLPPLLIAFMIAMVIWVVVPDYKVLRTKQGELVAAEQKLEDIRDKNQKISLLGQQYESSMGQQDILWKYLPGKKQEEDLISNINSLASAEGLAVFDLSVGEDEKNTVNAMPTTDVALDATGAPVDPGQVIVPPVTTDFQMNVGVVGDYEKIRNIVNKIAKLKRFDSISSLKIGEVTTGDESGAAGSLQANLVLNLNYFPKKEKMAVDANNDLFSSGKFSLGIVDDIVSRTSTDINRVEVGATSRSNPFRP